jgi:predicted ATPase
VRLKIENIGKINNSEIKLDGITVIAGENNSGKSAFGKVLYCVFNAFCNAEDKIRHGRMEHIKGIIRHFVYMRSFEMERQPLIQEIAENLLLLGDKLTIQDFQKELEAHRGVLRIYELDDYDIVNDKIKSYLAIDDTYIQTQIITRYFYREFDRQINHVNKQESTGKILWTIKERNIEIEIYQDKCSRFDKNEYFQILYNAIYIDDPFILDDRYYPLGVRDHKIDLRNRLIKENEDNPIIEEIIANQKLENALSIINSVVKGKCKADRRKGFVFAEESLQKPLNLKNVSAGLKTFLIIKRLLEIGEIKERGVLILDEPEIHLHPEWQLKFAEILVVLQKELNLTMLITTHSPYFLEAIEVYSAKYNIKDRCSYYLTEVNGDTADAKEVTENVDKIYKQLAKPFYTFDKVIYGDNQD